MNPLELAYKYMEISFSEKDLNLLKNILTNDCKFVGPFYQFNSAQDYIDSLFQDPPINIKYEVIKTYQDDHSACLIYNFTKPGITTKMTQIFEVSENKISGIQLIFDTKPFSGS